MVVAEPDGVRAAVFLRRDLGPLDDRRPHSLRPRVAQASSVLGAEEVVRFLEAVSSLKKRMALTTAYAAGLRVSEVAALKISERGRR